MRLLLARILLPLVALLFAGCAQEEASPEAPQVPKERIEARASVDRAVATTGDLLTYSVTVDHEAGIELEMPQIASEIAGFRIVDLGRDPTKTEGERVIERQWYELRADLVCVYEPDGMPAAAVVARAIVRSGADGLVLLLADEDPTLGR